MKSKRSRKYRARRKRNMCTSIHANKTKNQVDLNLLVREIFKAYETSEAEYEKALDECPTIGIFKVRKSFNTHESV